MTSLNPTMTIGDQIAETVRLHRGAGREVAQARAVEVLGLVGMPRPAERVKALPASAVRRHAPAGHDRDGARRRAEAADRRRADDGAGRDHPEADPGAASTTCASGWAWRSSWSPTTSVSSPAGPTGPSSCTRAGSWRQTGTQRLFANPRHPYTEALFEALPGKAAEPRRRLYNIPGKPPDLTRPPRRVQVRAAVPLRAGRMPRRTSLPLDSQRHRPQLPVLLPGRPGPARRRVGIAAEVTAGARRGARRRARAAKVTETGTSPLLTIQHLVKNFAVTSARAAAQDRRGQRRRRRKLHHPARPDVRHGRGVGLRQDHGRPADRRAWSGPTAASIAARRR